MTYNELAVIIQRYINHVRKPFSIDGVEMLLVEEGPMFTARRFITENIKELDDSENRKKQLTSGIINIVKQRNYTDLEIVFDLIRVEIRRAKTESELH